MNALAKSFFKGLLVVVPLVGTVTVLYWVVRAVDRLLGIPVPGVGLALTLAVITLVGGITSHALGGRLVSWVEKGIGRLPVVKLLYTSIRDLMGAFVGDRRSFDKPVMVELLPGHGIRTLGFVTCTHFDDPKLDGFVAVYLPQSYNFAGNVVVVPHDRVHPVDADGAQFMAFIVSGGVAEMNAARTVMDPNFRVPLKKRS